MTFCETFDTNLARGTGECSLREVKVGALTLTLLQPLHANLILTVWGTTLPSSGRARQGNCGRRTEMDRERQLAELGTLWLYSFIYFSIKG